MRKRLMKVFSIVMTVVIVMWLIQPYTSASASEKSVVKKLKKNAWSSSANPDSAQVSRGYALYKIYEAIMDSEILDDPNWQYVMVDAEDHTSEYSFKKIGAKSKSQKKAIKWLLANVSFEPYLGSTEKVFDGKDFITRREFMRVMSCVCAQVFPYWLKNYNGLTISYYSEGGSLVRGGMLYYYLKPLKNGIVVGEELHLDDYMTKEDLKRAIKNFKIVLADRIQPTFEENPNPDYAAMIRSFKKTLEKNGCYVYDVKEQTKMAGGGFSGNISFTKSGSISNSYIKYVSSGEKQKVAICIIDDVIEGVLIIDPTHVDVEKDISNILKRFIQ